MLYSLVVNWHVNQWTWTCNVENTVRHTMAIPSWSSYWESSNQVQTIQFAHTCIYAAFDGVRQHHKLLLCYILRSSHSVPITISVRIHIMFWLRYVMIAWNMETFQRTANLRKICLNSCSRGSSEGNIYMQWKIKVYLVFRPENAFGVRAFASVACFHFNLRECLSLARFAWNTTGRWRYGGG